MAEQMVFDADQVTAEVAKGIEKIQNASNLEELKAIKTTYAGADSAMTKASKAIGSLPVDQKKEAGKLMGVTQGQKVFKVDLIDAMIQAGNPNNSDEVVMDYERSACPTCGSCSGMFTANSMNCLMEALGMALPGNGTLLATHADRKELFLQAARKIVEITKRYYEQDDASILPRSIVTKSALENAMALDVAMGGSTNTVLHLLAAANEGEIPFVMADIDRVSRRVPCLCKVSPATHDYYVEDVHRAGGILGIMAELNRAGLIDLSTRTVYGTTLGDAIGKYDVMTTQDEAVRTLYKAAPGGVRTQEAFSQNARHADLDLDRVSGCIRDRAHAYTQDGGLAVLHGNIAENGCIVKTAGVDASIMQFTGKARIFESQEDTVEAILGDRIHPGDVIIVRYEGPKGGPGMQEMLYPTS